MSGRPTADIVADWPTSDRTTVELIEDISWQALACNIDLAHRVGRRLAELQGAVDRSLQRFLEAQAIIEELAPAVNELETQLAAVIAALDQYDKDDCGDIGRAAARCVSAVAKAVGR